MNGYRQRKMGVFAVDFREKARNWWVYWSVIKASFERRRDREEEQGAGVVRLVWMGVEMWVEMWEKKT
jgi:hypothetical protein